MCKFEEPGGIYIRGIFNLAIFAVSYQCPCQRLFVHRRRGVDRVDHNNLLKRPLRMVI